MVEGKLADGTLAVVDHDQGVRPDSAIEKIRSLPPLYKPGGTICAASASGENDGAAAAVLMSKERARELNLVPMVTVRSMAWVNQVGGHVCPHTQVSHRGQGRPLDQQPLPARSR